MSGHTPGPWVMGEPITAQNYGPKTRKAGRHVVYVQILHEGPRGERIAATSVYPKKRDGSTFASKMRVELGEERPAPELSDAECVANAALIAAAPDLLAALERALGQMTDDDAGKPYAREDSAAVKQMRAAIAKARGGK